MPPLPQHGRPVDEVTEDPAADADADLGPCAVDRSCGDAPPPGR